MKMKNVIQSLGASKEKKQTLDILGRWNILTRGLLAGAKAEEKKEAA